MDIETFRHNILIGQQNQCFYKIHEFLTLDSAAPIRWEIKIFPGYTTRLSLSEDTNWTSRDLKMFVVDINL